MVAQMLFNSFGDKIVFISDFNNEEGKIAE